MGMAAYSVDGLLSEVMSPKLSCIFGIMAAVGVYAILVLALKIITYEDCLLLPKGEKIAKLLRIEPEQPE
jgi:stage V sporulation protein B